MPNNDSAAVLRVAEALYLTDPDAIRLLTRFAELDADCPRPSSTAEKKERAARVAKRLREKDEGGVWSRNLERARKVVAKLEAMMVNVKAQQHTRAEEAVRRVHDSELSWEFIEDVSKYIRTGDIARF